MPPDPLVRQLAELAELLGHMCTTAATALSRASLALLDGHERLAEQVVAGDVELDAQRTRIEEIAGDALLFHAPVAGDLRAVVAAIRAASDIERMGDLALHVARAAQQHVPVPDPVRPDVVEMNRLAVAMARKAADAVGTRNVVVALELEADDDAMDRHHRHLLETLLADDWAHGVPAAVHMTLLARYYERFADHAVIVARETIYAVTGQDPDTVSIQASGPVRVGRLDHPHSQPKRPET